MLIPEGASLKHFLKADNIVLFHNFFDFLEAFFFVIILVGLNRRWPEKNIISKQFNFLLGRHIKIALLLL